MNARQLRHSQAGFVLLALVLAACSDTTGPGAAVAALSLRDGNGQSGTVGTTLAQPFRVVASDAEGQPVGGVTVTWAVATGGGSLSTSTSTDAGGISQVTLTLGPAEGEQTVTASVSSASGSPVTFTATALAVTTLPGSITLVATVPIPPNYGIHDTYVRDGLAFVSAWDEGLWIYDVGDGRARGSPAAPVRLGTVVTSIGLNDNGPSVHNSWWFHSPTGQKKYLFVGEEGPGSIGISSSGDLHVVDVTDMANPVEVASYHHPDRLGNHVGVHNVWMDEPRSILYAAFYNGGVVAFNVSGTLQGDLSSRVISAIQPGGDGATYVWGVMLGPNGSLYASDMLSGLWQLSTSTGQLAVVGGGANVPERFGSDLWIHPSGAAAYTGTWGNRNGMMGNVIKVWSLDAFGAPTLATSVTIPGVVTISDVEVSPDGRWMMATAEYGSQAGLYLYDLATPLAPVLLDSYLVPAPGGGLHTGTISAIGGRVYVFAARDPTPDSPALMVFDVTDVLP